MTGAANHRVILILCRRALVRFIRQPARIASAVGTPLLLWLFMGSGFAGSFRPAELGDVSYSAYLLPGMMTLVAVFTAIFASISVIEDRQHGWLQAAIVAPISRWSLAVGEIVGGALIAWVQGAVVLAIAPLLGIRLDASSIALALLALAVTSTAMSGLGLALAWHSESTASFHAVMNLVLAPMWLLSSAFFPPPDAPGPVSWLGWVMRLNPLTWCTQAIRGPMLDQSWALPLLGAGLFAAAMVALAIFIVSRPTETS